MTKEEFIRAYLAASPEKRVKIARLLGERQSPALFSKEPFCNAPKTPRPKRLH